MSNPFVNVAGLSKPSSKSGKLQRILLKLLQEHEQNGALPTYNRFLYYELIARKIISKVRRTAGRRNDQDMTDALTHLRDKGIVPWDWIDDERARPTTSPAGDRSQNGRPRR